MGNVQYALTKMKHVGITDTYCSCQDSAGAVIGAMDDCLLNQVSRWRIAFHIVGLSSERLCMTSWLFRRVDSQMKRL